MQKGKIYGMGSSTIFLDLYSINCRDWTRVHCSNLKGKPNDSEKKTLESIDHHHHHHSQVVHLVRDPRAIINSVSKRFVLLKTNFERI